MESAKCFIRRVKLFPLENGKPEFRMGSLLLILRTETISKVRPKIIFWKGLEFSGIARTKLLDKVSGKIKNSKSRRR